MGKNILILSYGGDSVAKKIKYILKKNYENIGLYNLHIEKDTSTFRKILKWVIILKKVINDIIKKVKYKKLIGIGSFSKVELLPFFLFTKSNEKIFFPYDITNFLHTRNKIRHKFKLILDKISEEIILRISDRLIHKGLKNELEFLPFYDKIKNKPHYLFREFLYHDLVQEYNSDVKLSKKDGEIHLVYVGGLYLEDKFETESFWKFYPKITKQRLHLHLYSKQSNNVVKRFKGIEQKDHYFHYEGFRKHEELVKELVKYDYGLHIFGNVRCERENLILSVSFANKIYDYIAARLPIICSKDLQATKNFIEKYNLGFSIFYKDLKDLKKEIRRSKNQYNHVIEAIEKYIKKNLKDELFLKWITKG